MFEKGHIVEDGIDDELSKSAQLKLTGWGCPLSFVIGQGFKPIYVS
ncbi:hypothetical protein [Nostoc sp.]